MILGCDKKDDQQMIVGDCHVLSFMESVSRDFDGNTTYIIKGIVLDKYEHYGLKIRFVEDLKGNFPKNVTTFDTWGANTPSTSYFLYRSDNLTIYKTQDVLIMHLLPVLDYLFLDQQRSSPEKSGDYTTLPCTYSVLKLSDDYVTGYLSMTYIDDKMWHNASDEEKTTFYNYLASTNDGRMLEYMKFLERSEMLQEFLESSYNNYHARSVTNTMPLEDFRKKLNELLTNN